jgi:hypothetical protein
MPIAYFILALKNKHPDRRWNDDLFDYAEETDNDRLGKLFRNDMLVFTCAFIGYESGLMMKTIKTKKCSMAFANEKTPEMRIPNWNFQPGQKKNRLLFLLTGKKVLLSTHTHKTIHA